MTTQEAFMLVYKQLMQNPMYRGSYDARNGDNHFMYGIASVMESIAYYAGGDSLVAEFNTYWNANMESSEAIAEIFRKAEWEKGLHNAKMEEQTADFEKEFEDYEKAHTCD
jgi:hypothetical protein